MTAGDDRDVIAAFDREAATYGARYTGTSLEAHGFVTRRRRVLELVRRTRPSGVILDVGCGPGVMVGDLRREGWRYVGVDPAAAMLKESRARFGDAVWLVGARIEALPFPSEAFEIALAIGVLEYLEDPRAAVREFARVVKRGGHAIVTVPNRLSPYRIWTLALYRPAAAVAKALIRRRPSPGLKRRAFQAGECRRLLAGVGMTVTDIVYYGVNVLPPPLDRLFPEAAVRIAASLERLGTSRAGVLGTGFVIAARKA